MTGCTCCSSENHYRGFYRTKEDAERRIRYYYSPDSKFWPLASQYARRGRYSIEEVEIEDLKDGRYILDDEKVLHELNFIEVKEDGSIKNDDSEYLWSDL
jgi:hypothetical protein